MTGPRRRPSHPHTHPPARPAHVRYDQPSGEGGDCGEHGSPASLDNNSRASHLYKAPPLYCSAKRQRCSCMKHAACCMHACVHTARHAASLCTWAGLCVCCPPPPHTQTNWLARTHADSRPREVIGHGCRRHPGGKQRTSSYVHTRLGEFLICTTNHGYSTLLRAAGRQCGV